MSIPDVRLTVLPPTSNPIAPNPENPNPQIPNPGGLRLSQAPSARRGRKRVPRARVHRVGRICLSGGSIRRVCHTFRGPLSGRWRVGEWEQDDHHRAQRGFIPPGAWSVSHSQNLRALESWIRKITVLAPGSPFWPGKRESALSSPGFQRQKNVNTKALDAKPRPKRGAGVYLLARQ